MHATHIIGIKGAVPRPESAVRALTCLEHVQRAALSESQRVFFHAPSPKIPRGCSRQTGSECPHHSVLRGGLPGCPSLVAANEQVQGPDYEDDMLVKRQATQKL